MTSASIPNDKESESSFYQTQAPTIYLRLDSNVADQDDGWNKKQAKPETRATVHIAILYTVKSTNKQTHHSCKQDEIISVPASLANIHRSQTEIKT